MNKLRFLGIVAFAAAMVFALTGCPDDLDEADPALNGTWVRETKTGTSAFSQTQRTVWRFDNGNFEEEIYSIASYINFSDPYIRARGTYTTGDNIINWGGSTTSYNGAYYVALNNYYASLGSSGANVYSAFESRWYSEREYIDIMKSSGQYREPSETYTAEVTTYEVSGNTLTLTSTIIRNSDGNVAKLIQTYTRK